MSNIITLLGVIFFFAAAVSLLLRQVKQSSIVAFILVGIIAGTFKNVFTLPKEMIDIFTELGIIFLLFMAGLEIDFESFRKRWKIVLTNGLGQILINTLFGALVGLLFLDMKRPSSLIYFGLCLTFSSTIICISYLKKKKELETLHGQLVLGLMVLQDVTAVISLVMLKSIQTGESLVIGVALILLKSFILIALLFILSKTVLPKLFKYLAKESDMMFLGTLGWSLGIAALCEIGHFSPEIGAFMAGAALSFLPYRLEIQDKVEPMKDFGIILFFLALGFNLDISSSLVQFIPPILITSIFVLFFTPILMIFLGFTEKLKSRPAFFTGAIINQISEFSLILATLCLGAGIFDKQIFTIITFACILTVIFSSAAQQFIPTIYGVFKKRLEFLDKRSKTQLGIESEGFKLKNHIILLSYNELAEKLIDQYNGKDVLLIEIDPDICDKLKKRHSHVQTIYADMFDPDTWEEAKFDKAAMIVSCLVRGQEAEIAISQWLKDQRAEVPFIVTTDSRAEALELYENGATYVIQTEDMAAEYTSMLFHENMSKRDAFVELGKKHFHLLKEKSVDELFEFY